MQINAFFRLVFLQKKTILLFVNMLVLQMNA
jgi:hypothetical protein